MGDERLVITEAGFLTEFVNQHTQRTERPFCFILGAGVSRSSGIPTGAELAKVWLDEMYEAENHNGLSLETWATSERLEIKGFTTETLGRFYPQLYKRRYDDYEQGGYAFLESQMEGKEPSYGYSVLSYLLSETSHRVVVTTNFDNLVADALSIYSDSSQFPLVIGHDALAQYAAVELRRPLVAKVHGALGLSPKSQPNDISQLSDGWCLALGRILDRYTPIVIGYEGNDGSLMGFLSSLPPHTPERIFWCVYAPDAKGPDCLKLVTPEVREYVLSRRGRFVPIRGFDELMRQLGAKLGVPNLLERMKERARRRELNYDDQQRRLEATVAVATREKSEEPPSTPLNKGGDSGVRSSDAQEPSQGKSWFDWLKEAKAQPDFDSKRKTYLQAIEAYPNNEGVLRTYGLFLELEGHDPKAAGEYYQAAMKANPADPVSIAFYAILLQRQDRPDEAEKYFERVLEIDPRYSYGLTVYARFLHTVRKDLNKAEELYQRAIASDPTYEYAIETYAEFLRTVRGNPAKAKELEARKK